MASRSLYFVRVCDNEVAIGFFFSAWENLPHLIDESCDPDLCEAARIDFDCGIEITGMAVLHRTGAEGEFLAPDGEAVENDWSMTDQLATAVSFPDNPTALPLTFEKLEAA